MSLTQSKLPKLADKLEAPAKVEEVKKEKKETKKKTK